VESSYENNDMFDHMSGEIVNIDFEHDYGNILEVFFDDFLEGKLVKSKYRKTSNERIEENHDSITSVCVTGKEGIGKTTVIKEVMKKHASSKKIYYIQARNMNEADGDQAFDAVKAYITKYYPTDHLNVDVGSKPNVLSDCVIVLDNFEEYCFKNKINYERAIEHLNNLIYQCKEHPCKLIILFQLQKPYDIQASQPNKLDVVVVRINGLPLDKISNDLSVRINELVKNRDVVFPSFVTYFQNNEWDLKKYNCNINYSILFSRSLNKAEDVRNSNTLEELAVDLFINHTSISVNEELMKEIISADGQFDESITLGRDFLEVGKHAVKFQNRVLQEYYLSKWIVKKLFEVLILDDKGHVDVINFLKKMLSSYVISNGVVCFLEIFSGEKSFDKISIESLRASLFISFNKLLETNFFDIAKESREHTIVFFNFWKILKAFFKDENPVTCENKDPFIVTLKRMSILNDTMKFISAGDLRLNLSFMDFSNADLSNSIFQETDFGHTNCVHTNFSHANLDASTFYDADLRRANFESTFMETSEISNCDCSNASFKKAHLLASDLVGSNFSFVNLEGTNFTECVADEIVMTGVIVNKNTAFNDATFENVSWNNVNLSHVSISNNQIPYFFEIPIGIRDIKVYDSTYKLLEDQEKQKQIYTDLLLTCEDYLKKNNVEGQEMDVFISHASEEKKSLAIPLSEKLRDRGFDVWLDDLSIKSEDKLRFEIEKALSNCKTAIIILSESFAIKGWTNYEWDRIMNEKARRDVDVLTLMSCHTANTRMLNGNTLFEELSKVNNVLIFKEFNFELICSISNMLAP